MLWTPTRVHHEIHEQPEVLARVLDGGWPGIVELGKVLRDRGFRFAVLAARGTSDSAALYAKYLFENLFGFPTAFASPSSFSPYGARMNPRDVLVVGVSLSGESKAALETVSRARKMGGQHSP